MAPPEFRDYTTSLPSGKQIENGLDNAKDHEKEAFTVDEALSKLGFGKVQFLMSIMASCCFYGITSETMG